MEASLKLLETTSDKTIDKKIYILATVGSRASILLADLLSPLCVGDVWVTYDAMKIALMNHFKSQRVKIAELPSTQRHKT